MGSSIYLNNQIMSSECSGIRLWPSSWTNAF